MCIIDQLDATASLITQESLNAVGYCDVEIFTGIWEYSNGCNSSLYRVEISCDENRVCKYSEHKLDTPELTLEGFFDFDDEISWGLLGNCALGSPLINDGKGIALDDGTSTKKYFGVAIEQYKVEGEEVLAIDFYNGNYDEWYTIKEGSTKNAYRIDAGPKMRRRFFFCTRTY